MTALAGPKLLLRLVKRLARVCGVLVGLVALYLLAAWLLPKVTVNPAGRPGPHTVYLVSNGVHTDLVLPVHHAGHDWRTMLDAKHAQSPDTAARWIAFGWGDKGFYLDTPTWAELKASTAFKAAFGLGGSAMHITWCHEPAPGPRCRRFTLSDRAFLDLVRYIRASFKPGAEGLPVRIEGAHYERTDVFYEGVGTYTLFGTCNGWTNTGLKACGAKACLWTPFQGGLMDLYEP